MCTQSIKINIINAQVCLQTEKVSKVSINNRFETLTKLITGV